ncbi:MAG: hypothetical protein VX603_07835 [Gemmatimonadota bacterium]|nr:hypothetical protein [Gemmatimonadota bacterium]
MQKTSTYHKLVRSPSTCMTYLFHVPPNIAFFNCGDIRLMLTLPEREDFDQRSSIIYYKVD